MLLGGVPFLRFEFTLSRLIILDTELAFASTETILDENNIEFDRSEDLQQESLKEDQPNQNQNQELLGSATNEAEIPTKDDTSNGTS